MEREKGGCKILVNTKKNGEGEITWTVSRDREKDYNSSALILHRAEEKSSVRGKGE